MKGLQGACSNLGSFAVLLKFVVEKTHLPNSSCLTVSTWLKGEVYVVGSGQVIVFVWWMQASLLPMQCTPS